MKCPFCDGTGKCYQQTITYEEVEKNRTNEHLTKCFKCNGTGEIEQTNEEWFATLTTEEKAEFLSNSGMFESCNEALFWLREKHEDDN